ncbi:MAG: enoyl-CoA hydratase-related protein [Alphaproteobacteria bacterium]|nr:enoyl-CoA hydratase-related protein [Alphaproteobacteria bacterium]
MTAYTDILADTPKAGVRLITLNRPKVLNALRSTLLEELAAEIAHARDDAEIRVVVLTGNERAFAAGADIAEMADRTVVDVLGMDRRMSFWHALRSFPKPLIAAVNGFALGGGCELAMCADIIVAGEGARFGQPEINLGLIPGAGGTQRLTRAVGKSRAMKMVLTGEAIDARAALAAGLIAEVVPPELALDRALELAETIAAKPPVAVRLAKEAVLKAQEMTLEAGLDYERKAFAMLFATEDRREGVQAFLEKRKPVFKGR